MQLRYDGLQAIVSPCAALSPQSYFSKRQGQIIYYDEKVVNRYRILFQKFNDRLAASIHESQWFGGDDALPETHF